MLPPSKHASRIINRVSTVLFYMTSNGIDPCSSESICSSMVRFSGLLELDVVMNEWGKHINKNPLYKYMAVINQYIIRWNRKITNLKYTELTYTDTIHYAKIAGMKQEIVQKQTIIDELVEKVFELPVDRALLGMVFNHYADRNRIDISESVLIGLFGEDSDIIPDFLKVERDESFLEREKKSRYYSNFL
jgi:hypothetical protein